MRLRKVVRKLAFVFLAAWTVFGCSSAGDNNTAPGGGDDASTPGDDSGSDGGGGGADASSDVATSDAPIAHDGGGDTSPPRMPICKGPSAGMYCGNDMVQDGDPSTLYNCPGTDKAPTSSMKCPDGCVTAPQGTDDYCKTPVAPNSYKLPWPAGVTMSLTQDCNDSCCNDHVGNDEYAWDWANGGGFEIRAARGGVITHLKDNSTNGCGSNGCVNDANFIVIDHGDGTQSTYLHLEGMTLRAGVTCGASVSQGQPLATSGTTGWSTGVHLHFQVSKVHAGAPTCECGADGNGCAPTSVPWGSFWVTSAYPSLPIAFVEWPNASQCNDRRITMPPSQN